MKNTKKHEIIQLRKKGRTYSEIQKLIGAKIPKSTLSYWLKDIKLPKFYNIKRDKLIAKNLENARLIAKKIQKDKRVKYLDEIYKQNVQLKRLLFDINIAKLLLACLYLAEGGKKTKGSLVFGNSDPLIIKLFIKLLNISYKVDKNKFRCTVQCRADQNIELLEKFWSGIVGLPLKQFYQARIDPRTIGKKTKKIDYKGVCKIDYFSAHLFNELTIIGKIITE